MEPGRVMRIKDIVGKSVECVKPWKNEKEWYHLILH